MVKVTLTAFRSSDDFRVVGSFAIRGAVRFGRAVNSKNW